MLSYRTRIHPGRRGGHDGGDPGRDRHQPGYPHEPSPSPDGRRGSPPTAGGRRGSPPTPMNITPIIGSKNHHPTSGSISSPAQDTGCTLTERHVEGRVLNGGEQHALPG